MFRTIQVPGVVTDLVSVIETVDGNVISVTSFTNDNIGREVAFEHFLTCARENGYDGDGAGYRANILDQRWAESWSADDYMVEIMNNNH